MLREMTIIESLAKAPSETDPLALIVVLIALVVYAVSLTVLALRRPAQTLGQRREDSR
jgi:hypothetical protein